MRSEGALERSSSPVVPVAGERVPGERVPVEPGWWRWLALVEVVAATAAVVLDLLLPSLVRAATGLERLAYQVAPGLSEMPKDFYPQLDFEAAKVAFLVDGDGGGDELSKALGREVPADRIVKLDVPGIENTLDADTYRVTFAAH